MRVKLFRGMVNDVRRRAPYYYSDWSDALDYRVVPSTGMRDFCLFFPGFVLCLVLTPDM